MLGLDVQKISQSTINMMSTLNIPYFYRLGHIGILRREAAMSDTVIDQYRPPLDRQKPHILTPIDRLYSYLRLDQRPNDTQRQLQGCSCPPPALLS
jgi:hypothetical protein